MMLYFIVIWLSQAYLYLIRLEVYEDIIMYSNSIEKFIYICWKLNGCVLQSNVISDIAIYPYSVTAVPRVPWKDDKGSAKRLLHKIIVFIFESTMIDSRATPKHHTWIISRWAWEARRRDYCSVMGDQYNSS